EGNLQAFRYGRLWAHDPARVEALVPPARPSDDETLARSLAPLGAAARRAHEALLGRCDGLDEESRRLVAVRAAELIDYEGGSRARLARRYVDVVLAAAAREREVVG